MGSRRFSEVYLAGKEIQRRDAENAEEAQRGVVTNTVVGTSRVRKCGCDKSGSNRCARVDC